MDEENENIFEICVDLTEESRMLVINYFSKYEKYFLHIISLIYGCSYGILAVSLVGGVSYISVLWGPVIGCTVILPVVHYMNLDVKRAHEVLKKELTPEQRRRFLTYVMEYFDPRILDDSQAMEDALENTPEEKYKVLCRIAMFMKLEKEYMVAFIHDNRVIRT